MKADICVIGGGILGCMAARELSRYELKTVLVERKEDVCCGITKANSAVVYPGYDHKPGTLKSRMCIEGNKNMAALCEELGVAYKQTGSIMVGFGPKSERVLRKKYEQGTESGMEGLQLLSGEEVRRLEPNLSEAVTAGLYSPDSGTVNPWELGIAAYEQALENGVEAKLNRTVTGIRFKGADDEREDCESGRFVLTLKDTVTGEEETLSCKGILNCAGAYADAVRELVREPSVRIRHTKAAWLLFSPELKEKPEHVVFYEPEEKGKGLTLVPVTDGALLVGATEEEAAGPDDRETTPEGLESLERKMKCLVPEADLSKLLCTFAGVRPNPYEVGDEERSIKSFVIDSSDEMPGMVSLIGIKTPGLTCCRELTMYAIEKLFASLDEKPKEKDVFRKRPKAEETAEQAEAVKRGRIICHCSQVTEGEIKDAIRRGAVNLEGIAHRCRTGMGYCQGTRCRDKVLAILKEERG